MTALHEFPGWIALIAAIALVLAAWLALVGAVLEVLIRRFRRTTTQDDDVSCATRDAMGGQRR